LISDDLREIEERGQGVMARRAIEAVPEFSGAFMG
jgi:hypothetical protein